MNLAEGLNFVHGVTVLIKKSAKHKQPIESIFACEDIITHFGLVPKRIVCANESAVAHHTLSYWPHWKV